MSSAPERDTLLVVATAAADAGVSGECVDLRCDVCTGNETGAGFWRVEVWELPLNWSDEQEGEDFCTKFGWKSVEVVY